ncbi:MAG: hypothetical protein NT150_02715 [Bacteroidetes bacterium]|nr:hypothetical protein [Bacteroidota bacterium]
MKKYIGIASLALAAIMVTSSSCETDECTGEICTESFAYISLELKDTLNKPYILDSYTVTPQSGGDAVLSKTLDLAKDTTGLYVVLSDTEKSKVTKDGVYFNFVGKKGGIEVVNLPYRIAHDCCHVVIKSGQSVYTVK